MRFEQPWRKHTGTVWSQWLCFNLIWHTCQWMIDSKVLRHNLDAGCAIAPLDEYRIMAQRFAQNAKLKRVGHHSMMLKPPQENGTATPHMWTTNLTYAGKGLGMPNSTQRSAGRMSRCAQTVKIHGISFPRSSLETTERSGTCMGRGAAPAFVGSYSIEDNPAREAVSPTWSHRYWATSYRNPLHESTIRTNCSQHNQTYRMTDLRVSLMQNCDPMQVWELGTLSLCVGHGISAFGHSRQQ